MGGGAGLESNANDIDLQKTRVVAHVQLEQLSEALVFIENVVSKSGEEKHALRFERTYVLYRLGRAEEALAYLRSGDLSTNVSRACRHEKSCLQAHAIEKC